jgi:hypothetical protein
MVYPSRIQGSKGPDPQHCKNTELHADFKTVEKNAKKLIIKK